MKFTSTREKNLKVSISEAMLRGLAPDRGLFVPTQFPKFLIDEFDDLKTLEEIAIKFLSPFFNGDPLEKELEQICNSAFNFPIPLLELKDTTSVLELYHGPTGAFKDVGARFLARCLDNLNESRTVLVATSGDTGSAVAAAFYGLSKIKVAILYPKGKISEFQEAQLTCWDKNILSLRVDCDFDACQKLVKEAFNDDMLSKAFRLTSANSINIGRLLPQCIYYIASSLWYSRKHGYHPSYVVPTGNMGNVVAAIWTKHMGFPIKRIVLSCNANDTVPIYFQSKKFNPKASIKTLANAMDVGNPSNMERFIDLIQSTNNSIGDFEAISVSDDQIKDIIKKGISTWGQIWCPHTATAVFVREKMKSPHWIIVSTAHPVKFSSIVQPLISKTLEIPPKLQEMLDKPSKKTDITSNIKDLENVLKRFNC